MDGQYLLPVYYLFNGFTPYFTFHWFLVCSGALGMCSFRLGLSFLPTPFFKSVPWFILSEVSIFPTRSYSSHLTIHHSKGHAARFFDVLIPRPGVNYLTMAVGLLGFINPLPQPGSIHHLPTVTKYKSLDKTNSQKAQHFVQHPGQNISTQLSCASQTLKNVRLLR